MVSAVFHTPLDAAAAVAAPEPAAPQRAAAATAATPAPRPARPPRPPVDWRELTLRVRLSFRLDTPGGRELIPTTELLLERDLTYSETVALAKAQEEAELYGAMQGDIVQQVLRRLARVPAPS